MKINPDLNIYAYLRLDCYLFDEHQGFQSTIPYFQYFAFKRNNRTPAPARP